MKQTMQWKVVKEIKERNQIGSRKITSIISKSIPCLWRIYPAINPAAPAPMTKTLPLKLTSKSWKNPSPLLQELNKVEINGDAIPIKPKFLMNSFLVMILSFVTANFQLASCNVLIVKRL